MAKLTEIKGIGESCAQKLQEAGVGPGVLVGLLVPGEAEVARPGGKLLPGRGAGARAPAPGRAPPGPRPRVGRSAPERSQPRRPAAFRP